MTRNNTNSNFNEIATTDANGSVIGITANLTGVHLQGGSNGQFIQTDGNGNLSWANASSGNSIPGGSNTQVQFNDGGALGASANFTFNKTNNQLTLNGNANVANLNAYYGVVTQDVTLTDQQGNYITLSAPQTFANYYLNLPPNDGDANQFLQTDGNGNLSWANATTQTPNLQQVTSVGGTSNANIALTGANISLGNVANVHILGGSNGQRLQTDGTGNLSWVTSTVGAAAGQDAAIQYNDKGNLAGAVGVSFSSNTLQTNNITVVANLLIGASGNANLGSVGNLTILGGNTGQFLRTDGSGNLSWANAATGNIGNAQPYILFTANAEGNNQSFANANLLNFSSSVYCIVFKNGVALDPSEYIITGNTLTVNNYLEIADSISVAPTGPTASGNGSSNIGNLQDTLVLGNSASIGITLVAGAAYTGNGGGLTNIPGANVTGTVALANVSNTANIANSANSVALANVVGIGNIANINLNGNANTVLAGNGAWVSQATGGGGNFANSNSITYNTTANTTAFSVVDSYISNIAIANSSYAFRSDVTFPSTYLLNNAVGRFMGTPDSSRTVTANLVVPTDSTDGSSTNAWQLSNVSTSTLTGGTYSFQTSDPMVVFAQNGQFNITETQYGSGNTVAGGALNVRAGVTLQAGTYPVYVAYVTNLGPSLQSVTTTSGSSNANISLTGANVSLGNIGNVKILGGNNGQVLSTNGSGNLSWIDNIQPGLGWSVTLAPTFDSTGGPYVGWSGTTQFPVFYSNGQVVATSGFTSTLYLGSSRNWPTDNRASVQLFANLYQQWHSSISGTLQINTSVVDEFRFTISTEGLATGINPTQSDATIQGLFNLNNPNAGPEFVNSLQYDDGGGLYPFQRARGGAVVYTENLQQVLEVGNTSNIGLTLTGSATYTGNGSGLTNIPGANVTGTVTNANVANSANSVALANVVGIGNIANINLNGNGTQVLAGNGTWVTQSGGSTSNLTLQQFRETVVSGGSVSGTISPDVSQGSIFTYTLTGNITLNTLTNVTAGTSVTILLTQDSTGNHTLSSTWLFASNNRTLSTAGSSLDVIRVLYTGSSYIASLVKGYQ